jgi:1,4-alpha-glucan branching enzyme
MPRGFFSLVLHAHLPFVRHPENADHLEERWLFEAIAGCYLPLVTSLKRMRAEGVAYKITVSLSPTLLEMLSDPLLLQRFDRHLARLDQLGGFEVTRTRHDATYGPVARYHADLFRSLRHQLDAIHADLPHAFADLQHTGHVELWTTAATHGFFPALLHHPHAIRAQISAGIDTFRRIIGVAPQGFWLPECGYVQGVDRLLVGHGLPCTILETHGLLHASPRPSAPGSYPIVTPSGLACFARDVESSRQVWSHHEGYPGDGAYRDFHHDIGYELDSETLRDFKAADGTRLQTGFKYQRVTGNGVAKQPYVPRVATERVAHHADHFVRARARHLRWLGERISHTPPILVAPYDAELFGHWWFEGVQFLEAILRRFAQHSDVSVTTPGDYLAQHRVHERVVPEESSWGAAGYSGVWIDPATAWMLPHVDAAATEIARVVSLHHDATGDQGRLLRQALREFLLLTSSDWAFLIRTRGAPHYARTRFETHLARLRKLVCMLDTRMADLDWLADLERRDNAFPSMDPVWFQNQTFL